MTVDVKKHGGEAAAAEAKIKNTQLKLNMAIEKVSRARDELDDILALPPLYEPSYYEELREAQRLAPMSLAAQIR